MINIDDTSPDAPAPAPARVTTAPLYSDDDLALRFAAEHADTLRHTKTMGMWHHWDGTRWLQDETNYHLNQVRSLCRKVATDGNKERKELASAKTVKAVLSLAVGDRRLAMHVDQWDSHPMLLATPGGTVDLKTGKLRPADPADHLTKSTAVAPGGACPLWLKTLDEIFCSDQESIDFMQRWAGYCLTGLVREEKFLFNWSTGRNGKGTFIETQAYVMGDYATTVPMTMLVEKRFAEHPTEIAELRGVRLALASETEAGSRWNSARIKLLTGGDRITARLMRQDFFKFWPSHKFMISSNQKPIFGEVDTAMRERLVMFAFLAKIIEKDTKLKEKLRQAGEASGILQWMIDGCLEWQRIGLAVPQGVVAATKEYLDTKDDFTIWLNENCTTDPDPTGRLETSIELHRSFVSYCRDNGASGCDLQDFHERLEQRGYEIKPRSNSVRRVVGLRLVTDSERAMAAGEAAQAEPTQGQLLDGHADDDPPFGIKW